MNVKSFWIRAALIVLLIFASLCFAVTPVYAQEQLPTSYQQSRRERPPKDYPPKKEPEPDGKSEDCKPPNCDHWFLTVTNSLLTIPTLKELPLENLQFQSLEQLVKGWLVMTPMASWLGSLFLNRLIKPKLHVFGKKSSKLGKEADDRWLKLLVE